MTYILDYIFIFKPNKFIQLMARGASLKRVSRRRTDERRIKNGLRPKYTSSQYRPSRPATRSTTTFTHSITTTSTTHYSSGDLSVVITESVSSTTTADYMPSLTSQKTPNCGWYRVESGTGNIVCPIKKIRLPSRMRFCTHTDLESHEGCPVYIHRFSEDPYRLGRLREMANKLQEQLFRENSKYHTSVDLEEILALISLINQENKSANHNEKEIPSDFELNHIIHSDLERHSPNEDFNRKYGV
jgi:hypothetical protein